MYRKIFIHIFAISLLTVLFTSVFMVFDLYYNIPDQFASSIDGIRVSVVNRNCEVPFHNWIDPTVLSELCKRPETKRAFESGFAIAKHYSPTLNEWAYYVALRTSPDQVLKLTLSQEEFYQFTHAIIKDILLGLCISILVVLFASWITTKRIVRPFNDISDNNHINSVLMTYPEIKPFIDKINEQEARLKEIAKYRTQFSANVSHELNTPVAEIMAEAQVIASGKLNQEEVNEFANDIIQSSKRLSVLIREILELSKFDESTLSLNIVKTNISEMIEKTVAKYTEKAHEKSLKFEVVREEEDIYFAVDEMLYSVVVKNLIENAIKYSSENTTITVTISSVGFSVNNYGETIPPDVIPRLFERFYRTDTARTATSTAGYGLGLAFVYNIVQAHSGKIEAKSDQQNGTTFSVQF
jgi:two-component system phosphate regulon sensor histidine kinase PhoR